MSPYEHFREHGEGGVMRWTLEGRLQSQGGDYCYGKQLAPGERVEVVPASYTDEDVERVATALLRADLLAAEEDAGAAASIALSAYLKDPA